MATVRDVLRRKSAAVWTVPPDATVYRALELMAEKNIGAVLVTQNERLVGIFSERDYARKVILHGRSSREVTVGELMSSPVLCVPPEESIESCMALMTERHCRHLPVREGERLVGIVSIGDIGKAIIAEQEIAIRNLESYITGVPA